MIISSVIVNKGKVLILQRSKDEDVFPGLWEIPGGGVEFGESVEDALIRETKEETGLNVSILQPVNVFDYLREKEDLLVHAIQLNFIVKMIGGKIKMSDEHDNFAWITAKDMEKYNLSKETKNVINLSFDLIKNEKCKQNMK